MIKDRISIINADIKEALKSVEAKHNVKIQLGSSSYSTADYSTKLRVSTPEANTIKGQESQKYAGLLGLPEDIIGKKFGMQGKEYEVVRLDIGKPKNPIIVQRVGIPDKSYKMTISMLKLHLKIP